MIKSTIHTVLLLLYVAGNITIIAEATPQSNTPSPGALPERRIYNAPEDDSLPIFKLRQWTQDVKDKSCVQEEECNLTAPRQYLQFWKLTANSSRYKFRFRESNLCLTAAGNLRTAATGTTAAATNQARKQQTKNQKQRRALVGDLLEGVLKAPTGFDAVLAHGGHPELQKLEGVLKAPTGFDAVLAHGGHPERQISESRLVRRQSTSAAAPNKHYVIYNSTTTPLPSASATSGTIALSSCVDSDTQVFQSRLVEKSGRKNKYYQIMSSSLQFNHLVPCKENDDAQLWLLENNELTIKEIDTTHTILEYAAAFQLKGFEDKLGFRRDGIVDDLTVQEIEAIETASPGAIAVFEMALELAAAIKAYVQTIFAYQQSGTPIISKLINKFLTPDDYPSAWDKIWGIATMVLGYIQLPGAADVVKFALMDGVSHVTREINKDREAKPPPPTELIAWDKFALVQCDYTADMLYAGFREIFQKQQIGQLRTMLEEFRAGKYFIKNDEFYHQYQVNFLKQLVEIKGDGGFWVSVCLHSDTFRCTGQ
ncbi:hypothetical protein BDF19DRAFT_438633 [Syncephalis fuscata]|nr:hypothetical protein BDF19DRAFT_438633 [Syncephalis fuscata]